MQTVDLRRLRLNPGDRVLDLGCGEGRHLVGACFAAPVAAVGVDLSVGDLATARRRLEEVELAAGASHRLICGRAEQLPFADHSFDVVICSEVLEHIDDYEQVLSECRRLLKPDGTLVASVPRYWPERICWALSDAYHAVEGGHIRIFRSSQLCRAVEAQGFRRFARHWAHALHSPFWWLKCLWWERQDESRLIRWYHRLLVWDLLERPWLTRALEAALNPLCGKSVVMYFRRDSAP
jgi:2-polyprenyl-3-methyl-5-hydroxy-6-metoxy-1,4-benzoquinol methylase